MLLCIPCSDMKECDELMPEVAQNSQDHSQHKHERENCTPFCTCVCCGSQVFNYNTFQYLPNKSNIQQTTVTENYQFLFSSDFCANIWQPPKIG